MISSLLYQYFRGSEMPILRKMVSWTMRGARPLSCVRSITTFTPKCSMPVASPTASLVLGSYCERNAQEDVYSKNRMMDGLIKSGHLNSALKLFDEMSAL
jgi:pentatricopeptide repeat protein